MPRLTQQEEQEEAKQLANDVGQELKQSHRWDAWILLVCAGIAVVIAILNWSASWAAAALTISCVHTGLNVMQRSQLALSFSSAMRENEYKRIMGDLTHLTKQGENITTELYGLRSSLTTAGVIPDQRLEILRLETVTASLRQKGDKGGH